MYDGPTRALSNWKKRMLWEPDSVHAFMSLRTNPERVCVLCRDVQKESCSEDDLINWPIFPARSSEHRVAAAQSARKGQTEKGSLPTEDTRLGVLCCGCTSHQPPCFARSYPFKVAPSVARDASLLICPRKLFFFNALTFTKIT